MKRILLGSLGLLLACAGEKSEGGPLMSPGQDCLQCHAAGEHAFTVAGTVYASSDAPANAGLAGVQVFVTDSHGLEVGMTSNAAGNFYTNRPLALPLAKAAVLRNGVRTEMHGSPTGACASCHSQPPVQGAPGRVYAP